MPETDALCIEGCVDDIRRLHQNPPVEWDNRTAWSIHTDGERHVLLESAVVACPDCDETAFWRNGHLRCHGCERKRLIG